MKKRFIYFYFMKGQPDKIREVVPRHVEYWRDCSLPGYMGGPFADRAGGLISFEAADLETAQALVSRDPFVVQAVIESQWVKEWVLE